MPCPTSHVTSRKARQASSQDLQALHDAWQCHSNRCCHVLQAEKILKLANLLISQRLPDNHASLVAFNLLSDSEYYL